MKRGTTTGKKFWALLLCACVLVSTLGMAPATKAQTPQTIEALEPLEATVAMQSAPMGTAQKDLNLPETLSATVDGAQANIAVGAWTSRPEYDSDTVGEYVFTPTLEAGYELAENVTLQSIEITVVAAQAVNNIGETDPPAGETEPSVAFTVDPDELLYLSEGRPVTEADLLASVTAADENGDPVEVSVQDTDGLDMENPAQKGDFSAYTITYAAAHPVTDEVFTATREAYVTEGIVLMSQAGSFTITRTGGGDARYGTDYEYSNNLLTIKSSTTMTISGTTTTDTIAVASGVQANITLAGVNIDVSVCALNMSGAGQSTVTLAAGSTNTLKSGDDAPGLYVPNGNKLTIKGAGSLEAVGGESWPGIGRDGNGNIEIQSGMITARSSGNSSSVGGGAGIGGSWGYAGGTITVSGGTINATGGGGGAGIGGGTYNAGGTIIISGGAVTATGGGTGSAGIGGGINGNAGSITVSGGTVNATGGAYGGSGIGSGRESDGGTVTISGGTVTASRNGEQGDDIGSGRAQNVATDVIITGGSVNASNVVISQPTNGSVSVYLNTLTVGNPSIGNDVPIKAMGYDSTLPYGCTDVVTKNGGKVYMWLPQNSNASARVDVIPQSGTLYTKTWARTETTEVQTLLRKGNATMPNITGQPTGGTYNYGSIATPLSVTANVTDEGTLSYQWYQNTTNNTTGGTPVGNIASYTPETGTVGILYYYCVVTNTNQSVADAQTAAATSNIVQVKVIDAPSVVSITVPTAVSVGQLLSLTQPTINDNGDTVTTQGWEISADGSTGWTAFNSTTHMTYAHNGQYLRYYATNTVGTGYSNTAQLTVNKLNLSLSLTCTDIIYGEVPNPQLTGNAGGGAVTYAYKAQGADDGAYSATVPKDAGGYTVRASVAATDSYNAASTTADFTVAKATPAITLTASPLDGSLADDSVTLTATLTGVSASDTPTGSVVFKNGGTVLGTVSLTDGEAAYTWEHVPFGTHGLTAEYAGNDNYAGESDTISGYDVQKKTQDALSITGVPQTLVYGDSGFSLSTAGGNGNGAVTYHVQSGDAVSVSGSTVTIEKAGTVVIQAVKDADAIYNETSAVITITVAKATPAITLTALPLDGSLADDSVTLTATLTGVSASDTPTGSVVFKNGGTVLGTVSLTDGEAAYTWEHVPFGTHGLTAEYAGNDNYAGESDTISGYDVQKKTQDALSITGVPQTLVYGDSGFSLSTAGGNGNGAVTYHVQSGDAVSVSGSTVTIEKAGTVVIQAVKDADAIYNETSAVITITVAKAVPAIQANPGVNGANVGTPLSSLSLSGLNAYGVGGTPLSGSFSWQNPQTVIQGAGTFTAVFTPNDESYEAVTFDVQVNLDTTKPVMISMKATPHGINGAVLEVEATAGTPLSYQWQMQGPWIDIPGATTATFDYTGLAANTTYTVRVIVTDANGNSTIPDPITFKTGAQAITGLPGSYTLINGQTVSFSPSPAGGTWSYDSNYLSMKQDGDKIAFTAKKVGKITATYTVNGTEFVVSITINDNIIPQTGVASNPLPYILLSLASLCWLGAVALKRKRRA